MKKTEMNKEVFILMSTYNGQAYLEEQLESIYNQSYNVFRVYIRDDGSTDSTIAILQTYAEKYENFFWFSGKNRGTSKSVFLLMKHIEIKDGIYVFADQDDVWLPNKLQQVVKCFSKHDTDVPLLYCGDTILVDDEMRVIKDYNLGTNIRPSFGNALIENICIGCTAAMNGELFRIIVKHIPECKIMHDWWFYLTAACYGNVFFDSDALVLYRQHRRNVIGSSATRVSQMISRIKRHGRHRGSIYRQLVEFLRIYNLDDDNRQLLMRVINYKKSLRDTWAIITTDEIYRQKKLDNLIFKALYLLKQV